MALPFGLPNQRNTCYINASLQCLRYIPELRKCIKNIKLPESSLSKILENLFEKLDAKKNINDSLNKVLNLIFKSKQFERGEPNDADSLLEYLIETMKNEGLNFICDIFTGLKDIKIGCSHCKFEKSFQSPFQILNIFPENEKKVENYINFREENEKCPHCAQFQMSRIVRIKKTPLYLFICVDKESPYDSGIFEANFILSDSSLGNITYKLVSEILYYGNTYFGHYTSIVKDQSLEAIFNFDDSYVKPSQLKNINNIYIAIYKKKDDSHRFWLNSSDSHELFLQYLGNYELYKEIVKTRFWCEDSSLHKIFLTLLINYN